MNKLIILAVVVIVLLTGLYYFRATNYTMPTNKNLQPQGGAGLVSGKEVSVSISNFSFNPSSIVIKKGTKVMWTNNDGVTHTVTSDEASGQLNSPWLAAGQSYSFVFDKTGTFSYHCGIHPSMQAKVIVTE